MEQFNASTRWPVPIRRVVHEQGARPPAPQPAWGEPEPEPEERLAPAPAPAPARRGRQGQFHAGQRVEYNSVTFGTWEPAVVERIHSDGSVTWDIRERADPSRIRPAADGCVWEPEPEPKP